MDCVIKSWISGMISDDLVKDISRRGDTTCAAWVTVESQFLGNREARALYLDTKFCGFVQGDLSTMDYYRHMKHMADDLGNLSEVVTDRTLILDLIHGLNECFANIGLHLRRSHPFPSFLEARDDLLLEELTMEHQSSMLTTLVPS